MNTTRVFSIRKRLRVCGWIAVCTLAAASLGAQSVTPRIQSEIIPSEVSPLKGSVHPLAQARFDVGRLPANTKLNSMSIVFKRSAAQEADLQKLIAAQQNPASSLYHQWLNPDQFAKRFGMAQADLDKVQTWLQQQGFSIESVARSRNMIRFSGTARQAENAFSTQLHYYKIDGEQHFAPSTELSVPAAVAPVVLAIRNLDSFRPKAQVVTNKTPRPRSSFTSSQSGNVFFAPGDIATVYDVKQLTAGGINGAGQTIAVVGQSAVVVSDIEHFQSAAGLTVKDPTLVLIPGTGNSTTYSNDELESDLDLEWAGAMAPGADIFFIYPGNDTSVNAFDSIQYAIDNKIGNIISVSYGSCEPLLGTFSLETFFTQAATQGQTILAASGDAGSTACFVGTTTTNPSLTVQEQVAVNYPASSPWVTGIGGTEITAANAAVGTYWQAATNSTTDNINSAIQYIPEVAWNDGTPNCGATNCLSASGGGASTLFTKPTWQAGVTGIPAANHRYVPDISLYSSPDLPGYLYCTSDTSGWTKATATTSAQQASCNSGFRDAATGDLTIAGGTSFATPVFAGMLALINQKAGYASGQGLINPILYTMAADSATYAVAFHDITSGNNNCTGGTADCSSSTNGFSAGTGYDEVTGLGSIDLNNLGTAWSALVSTTTSVSPANTAPSVGVSDTFTITVTSNKGTSIPTGNVTLVIDDGTPITGNALVNGTVTYPVTFTSTGVHQVVAQYLGDATHWPSTGEGTVTIAGSGTIALSATPATLTVTRGSSKDETITVTPAGSYTGTVLLTLSATDTNLTNLCYNFTNINSNGQGSVAITGAAAASTQLTLDTLATDCVTSAARTGGGKSLHRLGAATVAGNNGGHSPSRNGSGGVPAFVAFAGLLLVGFMGRYARKFSALAGLAALLAVGLSISACGGGGGSNSTVPNPPKGTYTITVTGQDSVTSTITGTTSFTFVIQ